MKLLNCFFVAAWVWAKSRFRASFWTRRSLHFRGLILHCGTAHRTGFRDMHVIEYIPDHQAIGTMRNMLVFFDGEYRVWKLRAVEVARFKTLPEAERWLSLSHAS